MATGDDTDWATAQAQFWNGYRAFERGEDFEAWFAGAYPDADAATRTRAAKGYTFARTRVGSRPGAAPPAGGTSNRREEEATMAQELSEADARKATNGQGTTAAHNTANRTQAIRDALEDVYQTDKKIEELMETHITPLRDHKKDVKKRMKEEYEVSTKQFNARYGLYQMERKALDNGDNTVQDLLRELFEVAPVGEQMDWVDAVNGQQVA